MENREGIMINDLMLLLQVGINDTNVMLSQYKIYNLFCRYVIIMQAGNSLILGIQYTYTKRELISNVINN